MWWSLCVNQSKPHSVSRLLADRKHGSQNAIDKHEERELQSSQIFEEFRKGYSNCL